METEANLFKGYTKQDALDDLDRVWGYLRKHGHDVDGRVFQEALGKDLNDLELFIRSKE